MGEVRNIFVSIGLHFLQGTNKLIGVDVGVDVRLAILDDSGNAEADIRDLILHSLDENWNNVLAHLIFKTVRQQSFQGVETRNSVVVTFLL